MTTERETCASRRALLTGAPSLAVVAAVAAETGIALANVADPYVTLCADYFRLRAPVDEGDLPGDQWDAQAALWVANDDKIAACRATTLAGVLAGMRIVRVEFEDNYAEGDAGSRGDAIMRAIIESAQSVLEREVARGH